MTILRWSKAVGIIPLFAVLFLAMALHASAPLAEAEQDKTMDLVKRVQTALADKGYNPGPLDGFWGPNTEKALISFQESEGIPGSGKLDKATRTLLFGSSASKPAMTAHSSTPAMGGGAPDTGADVPDSQIVWGRHK